MFIDYYSILEIDPSSSTEDIKFAFKTQALKWHPDKNPGIDTTEKMQLINEAYLILKDTEARSRYDIEYRVFKKYKQERVSQPTNGPDFSDASYTIKDDILGKWIKNARDQAVDLAKQTIEDLRGMIKVGTKEATKEAGRQFTAQIIIGIVVFFFISLGLCDRNVKDSVTPITKTQDSITPIDLSCGQDKSFIKYEIKNMGEISIPPELELQNEEYQRNVKKYISNSGQDYALPGNRVVFQQKGLNKKQNFSTYVRVIIETQIGKRGDFEKLSSKLAGTKDELKAVNDQLESQTISSFSGTGLTLLSWGGTDIIKVNDGYCIKVSYLRKLNDNPPVFVQMYSFQNNDKSHLLTLSCRESDEEFWEPLFNKIVCSLKFLAE